MLTCARRLAFCISFILVFAVAGSLSEASPKEYAVYTAPDGFKVVSYSQSWGSVDKLKSVYDELLRNTHGEEYKLLKRINLYHGSDPQGTGAAGRWTARWRNINGAPVLDGNRSIDIYNCSTMDSIDDMARIISHEYGHHFTYYYFYKKERRTWDQWRNSGYAAARNIKNHPRIKSGSGQHMWLIEEIAAEDYVQLFGSPTAKSSVDFKDISERLTEEITTFNYSTDTYNLHPQENYELPPASNLPGLKDYWLKASGLSNKSGKAPSQISLSLVSVEELPRVKSPQYKFSWNKSSDEDSTGLEYTLVWFTRTNNNMFTLQPVKTVTGNEALSAIFGAAYEYPMGIWEQIPNGVAYFVVYVKDSDKNITASKVLAVDFSNKTAPQTVLIDDQALSSGYWFSPRVKLNSRQLAFDVPPVIKNGRTLVPLRAIFENLGATVNWNDKTRTITAVKGNVTITLTIGQRKATVNNSPITLDVPPEISKGRTLIPLRFVSESLGAQVNWNSNLQLVSILQ